MIFGFFHHEIHGPLSLEDLWNGTHGFGGSVSRLRILFWLAGRGHRVRLFGNVVSGDHRGVEAIAGPLAKVPAPRDEALLILNNPPSEPMWTDFTRWGYYAPVLWAGNPFDPRWMIRLRKGELSRIVCVSQYHRELYRIYRGFEKVEVSYSGVDLDLLDRAVASQATAGCVAFCSAPRRTKGLHHVLRAWSRVRHAIPDARLLIFGSATMHDPRALLGFTGILDADLEREFPEYFEGPSKCWERHGIRLAGNRALSDVYGDLKSASIALVNCNWTGSFETYCRSAVEAQAVGVPVVGAARGALPETVRHGDGGLLVEGPQPKHLARTLLSLLGNPELRRRLGEQGRERVRSIASFEELAKDWEAIADRVIGGRPAPQPSRACTDLARAWRMGDLRMLARSLIRHPVTERMKGLLGGRSG